MFNRIVVPTLLIAGMWLAMGITTTAYVYWLDSSYQEDLEQHVSCVEAARSLQEHLWHVQADLGAAGQAEQGRLPRVSPILEEIQHDLATIAATQGPPEHDQLVREMQELALRYRQAAEAVGTADPPEDPPREIAERLADRSDELHELHQKLLREAAASREAITSKVMWLRGLALIFGPMLGWWMARHLGRVVNEIRITLETSADLRPDEVGAIQVRPGDDLALIRQQVEVVVERLRSTAEELKNAHQEVYRSDRLAAMGRLAAGVAHELRNPLTSVKLLIQFALGPGKSSLTEQQLQLMLEEIERMETTIHGLLDLSRPAPMQRARLDLRETLSRAVQLVAGKAARQRIAVRMDLGSEALLVDGDARQLHQVWVNLFLNALEAMPDGGTLEIRARRSPAPAGIRLEIQDTGHGIGEELLPRLFEPFVTTKERGTGLGLAISRRIIEAHGGTITAANAPPGGAVFVVAVPQTKESLSDPSSDRRHEVESILTK